MASPARPQALSKITIPHFPGNKLVVNRCDRPFDNFLDKVRTDTRSGFAIRKIITPSGGTKNGSLEKVLEKIQNGEVYVNAGPERVGRIEYGRDTLEMASSSSTITHSKVKATSRYKQEAKAESLRNRIIFVYRNGEEKTAPVKLFLDKGKLRSMDTVLQYISNKVNLTSGAVKSIHSMESGTKVTDVDQIRANMCYVAVGSGKHFQKNQVFNDSSGKITSPRDKATFGYPNNKLNYKESKKGENEEERVVTSSLSMPDVGLTCGIIASSEEMDKNVSQDLEDSNVDNDLDVKTNTLSIEHIANDTPGAKRPLDNNDTKTTGIAFLLVAFVTLAILMFYAYHWFSRSERSFFANMCAYKFHLGWRQNENLPDFEGYCRQPNISVL